MEYWQILILVVAFITAFFTGVLVGRTFFKSKKTIDGNLIIERTAEKELFRWVIDTDPEEIKMKEELYFKVQKIHDSQE